MRHFLFNILCKKIGESNTKLCELAECRDFMSRETGGFAGEDKIGKIQRIKVVVNST